MVKTLIYILKYTAAIYVYIHMYIYIYMYMHESISPCIHTEYIQQVHGALDTAITTVLT